MARKINVSFKEIDKEIKLHNRICNDYSDKSAFMKEAAQFYLAYLDKNKTPLNIKVHSSVGEDEEIMGIIGI